MFSLSLAPNFFLFFSNQTDLAVVVLPFPVPWSACARTIDHFLYYPIWFCSKEMRRSLPLRTSPRSLSYRSKPPPPPSAPAHGVTSLSVTDSPLPPSPALHGPHCSPLSPLSAIIRGPHHTRSTSSIAVLCGVSFLFWRRLVFPRPPKLCQEPQVRDDLHEPGAVPGGHGGDAGKCERAET